MNSCTPTEQKLLDFISNDEPITGRLLIAGNRSGQSACAAIARHPSANIIAHAFDAHHARQIRDRLTEAGHQPNTENHPQVLCTPSAPAADSVYFMYTARDMSAELLLDYLQSIFIALSDGGRFIAVMEGATEDSLKTLKQIWPKVHVVERGKRISVFKAFKQGVIVKERQFAAKWLTSVPGLEPIEFTSLPGCFCHRRADAGGLALAEVVSAELCESTKDLSLLDMGCGCGLVGYLIAKRCKAVNSLTLIDSHSRAIAAAQLNAQNLNLVPPIRYILSDDGLPRGEVATQDIVVGNPPYYSEYRIAEIFMETAYRALKPGGVCYMVVKTATGLQALQEKYFRTVTIIPRRNYCILRSVR